LSVNEDRFISHIPTIINGKVTRKKNYNIVVSGGNNLASNEMDKQKSTRRAKHKTVVSRRNNLASNEMDKEKSTRRTKHKVIFVGDSHLRGSVFTVKSRLSTDFEIFSLIKPGAGAEEIMNTTISNLQSLTKNDVLVFNGGANHVNKII
jgi:hypothetical protein